MSAKENLIQATFFPNQICNQNYLKLDTFCWEFTFGN